MLQAVKLLPDYVQIPSAFSSPLRYKHGPSSERTPSVVATVCPSLPLRLGVDAILEDVQVVCGCYGNDILRRMPSHV